MGGGVVERRSPLPRDNEGELLDVGDLDEIFSGCSLLGAVVMATFHRIERLQHFRGGSPSNPSSLGPIARRRPSPTPSNIGQTSRRLFLVPLSNSVPTPVLSSHTSTHGACCATNAHDRSLDVCPCLLQWIREVRNGFPALFALDVRNAIVRSSTNDQNQHSSPRLVSFCFVFACYRL